MNCPHCDATATKKRAKKTKLGYQNFGANSREAGGLPLITTSFFSPKLLLFLPNVCHHVDHFQRKQDRQGRFLVKQCAMKVHV